MWSAKIKLFSFVLKCNFNATLKTSRFAGYSHETQTRLVLVTETTFCSEHRLSILLTRHSAVSKLWVIFSDILRKTKL